MLHLVRSVTEELTKYLCIISSCVLCSVLYFKWICVENIGHWGVINSSSLFNSFQLLAMIWYICDGGFDGIPDSISKGKKSMMQYIFFFGCLGWMWFICPLMIERAKLIDGDSNLFQYQGCIIHKHHLELTIACVHSRKRIARFVLFCCMFYGLVHIVLSVGSLLLQFFIVTSFLNHILKKLTWSLDICL